jgi:hypothetical protein
VTLSAGRTIVESDTHADLLERGRAATAVREEIARLVKARTERKEK